MRHEKRCSKGGHSVEISFSFGRDHDSVTPFLLLTPLFRFLPALHAACEITTSRMETTYPADAERSSFH
jgi:hypothetical protein